MYVLAVVIVLINTFLYGTFYEPIGCVEAWLSDLSNGRDVCLFIDSSISFTRYVMTKPQHLVDIA